MSLRLLIAAVASVALVGTASAQYPAYGYSYTNPYTGYTNAASYGYNPYTGTFGGYNTTYNPWTGFGSRYSSYNNVYGGYAVRGSNYNAYSGYYSGYRSGYNPLTGYGYTNYRVNPGYYRYGYWR